MNYGQIRDGARNLVLDTDSAIDATLFEILFADAYNWLQQQQHDRAQALPGSSLGLVLSAGGHSMLTTINSVLKVHSLHLEATNAAVFGPPLRWVEPSKLFWMRRRSSAEGTPKYWTGWREAGTSDWRILVHPPADTLLNFSAVVERQATDLSADTEIPDLPVADHYRLQREIAYDMAVILERDDAFVDGLLPMLKDEAEVVASTVALAEPPRAADGASVT